MSGIPMLEYLASRFGKDSVVDVLAGTGLEQYSKDSGLGLYVVKAAVESSLQRNKVNDRNGTRGALTSAWEQDI